MRKSLFWFFLAGGGSCVLIEVSFQSPVDAPAHDSAVTHWRSIGLTPVLFPRWTNTSRGGFLVAGGSWSRMSAWKTIARSQRLCSFFSAGTLSQQHARHTSANVALLFPSKHVHLFRWLLFLCLCIVWRGVTMPSRLKNWYRSVAKWAALTKGNVVCGRNDVCFVSVLFRSPAQDELNLSLCWCQWHWEEELLL